MRFIGNVIEKLQRHPKRVVFPEGDGAAHPAGGPAVLRVAAGRAHRARRPGQGEGRRRGLEHFRSKASASSIPPKARIWIISPSVSIRLRREKGLRATEAREAMLQPNYFGTMMVAMHQADGVISGASHITGSVLRPLFQIIKAAPDIATASSCMIMEVEDTRIGENGVLFMADCGVIPDPTVDQLADIAVSTARLARHMLGVRPRVALLSFSTKGSASHPSVGKVQAATAMARRKAEQLFLEADFDGELQVDAALVPEIAERKLHDSKVAGRANVLIFPDLNSGNIASKLVRLVGHANAYGQILLGLNRPAADVSRGSNAHDILGVAAIVGVQAIDYQKLYPGADAHLPGE